MLGLHQTPDELETDWRHKNGQIRVTQELVGKVVCSSYVTHQKVIRSATNFNHQKTVVELSLASDPTRSWILLLLQVFGGWS